MKSVKVEIEGMTCQNCENHVIKELEKVGAKKIKVSAKEGLTRFNVHDDVTQNLIKDAVKTAGYTVKNIVFSKIKKGFFVGMFN